MRKKIAFFEMFLLVTMSISIAFIIAQGNSYVAAADDTESKFIRFARAHLLDWLSSGLVSAQVDDLSVWTCLENKNGTKCQEYLSSECNDYCSDNCFPGKRDDFAECTLGTCIDPTEGTCLANTPKVLCDESGGEWNERAVSELSECRPGCCLIGDNAQYITESTCSILSQRTGIENEFRQVSNELECLALGNQQAEGACVLGEVPGESKNDCKFTTKGECSAIGGEFNEGLLCSNIGLNTICEKQVSTQCFEGKDEVYWVDSCGNRENIYDSNKARSWNNGLVLPKSESCTLTQGNDPLGKQSTCGNCFYPAGSVCGTPREQDEAPVDGDFVCRDLACIDEQGNERSQGESWCVYESAIGVEGTGNNQRSVDVPGSSHYISTCRDGEVILESCAPGRREICTESNTNDFSTADCRANQWALCLKANEDPDDLAKCEENTDCKIMHVDMAQSSKDTFEFDLCVPKYPPGFNLNTEIGGSAKETQCALASLNCKKITIKEAFGDSTKINARCDDADFTETLNNLCMSLGDCGVQVNILGEYTTDGYSIKNAPELGEKYLSGLQELKDPIPGKVASPLSEDEIAALFGFDITDPNYNPEELALDVISGVTGFAGVALAYAGSAGVLQGTLLGSTAFLPADFVGPVQPGLGAAGGVVAGALIGAAITSMLIKFSGIGGGLSEEWQYALIIAGAAAGALIGFSLVAVQVSVWIPIVGWILAAATLAFIGIGWLLGWGKKKTKLISFQCLPWQPPKGGEMCGQCGDNGLPCNKYKCESLGQTCEFINEGTSDQACVNVAPDDVTAPAISPDEDALSDGLSYSQVSDSGFRVEGSTSDGCLPAYSLVSFGIEVDEAAQCKASELRVPFEEMEGFIGGSNSYKTNHLIQDRLPSLGLLGADDIVEPDERADFNMYISCSDKTGNTNKRDYTVSFCISPEDDLTPPIISRFDPQSNGHVALNATEADISFYTNEPSECRWDKQDTDFDVMANEVNCSQIFEESTPFGWLCETTLPINNETSEYNFRCKDQPWLEVSNPDNKERNKNSESVKYTLKRTENPLEIISISPNNETIYSAGLPVKIQLEVQTSGGAEDTLRECSYDHDGSGNYFQFLETGTNTHKQRDVSLWQARDYNIAIRCEDTAGNIATGNSQFTIEVDNKGPLITRAYNQNGLTIVTDSPAMCAYSHDSCSFNFENGSLMSGEGLVHTSGFETGLNYYVKCKDGFGNPGECLAITGGYNA